MPLASSSSTCITLSEGPESTDIDSGQAQQESVSILDVLRAPTPADISMKCTVGSQNTPMGNELKWLLKEW